LGAIVIGLRAKLISGAVLRGSNCIGCRIRRAVTLSFLVENFSNLRFTARYNHFSGRKFKDKMLRIIHITTKLRGIAKKQIANIFENISYIYLISLVDTWESPLNPCLSFWSYSCRFRGCQILTFCRLGGVKMLTLPELGSPQWPPLATVKLLGRTHYLSDGCIYSRNPKKVWPPPREKSLPRHLNNESSLKLRLSKPTTSDVENTKMEMFEIHLQQLDEKGLGFDCYTHDRCTCPFLSFLSIYL